MTMLDHLPALRSPDSLLGRAQLSGLRALLAALQSGGGPGVTVTDHLDAQPDPDVVVVLVADRAPTPATVEHLRHHLARGGRAVVALSPASALALAPLVSFRATGSVLAAPGADNPLVLDPHLVGTGAGVLGGLHLEADDLVALEATVTPTVTPAVTLAAGASTVVNATLGASGQARASSFAMRGNLRRSARGRMAGGSPPTHRTVAGNATLSVRDRRRNRDSALCGMPPSFSMLAPSFESSVPESQSGKNRTVVQTRSVNCDDTVRLVCTLRQ